MHRSDVWPIHDSERSESPVHGGGFPHSGAPEHWWYGVACDTFPAKARPPSRLQNQLPGLPWLSELSFRMPPVPDSGARSEEHTSELQSRENLVCRLLLEKKKK